MSTTDYSQLHAMLADPQLPAAAKLLALALERLWARDQAECWPAAQTIAAALGQSPGHVERGLKQLEAGGWIQRRREGRRRVITLRWRSATPLPPAPARPEVVLDQKPSQIESPTVRPAIQARLELARSLGDPILLREAQRLLQVPVPDTPPEQLSTEDLIQRLPGRGDLAAHVASRLCQELGDPGGFRPFLKRVIEPVVTRRVPPAKLLAARKEATNGRWAKPGAGLFVVWGRYAAAP